MKLFVLNQREDWRCVKLGLHRSPRLAAKRDTAQFSFFKRHLGLFAYLLVPYRYFFKTRSVA